MRNDIYATWDEEAAYPENSLACKYFYAGVSGRRASKSFRDKLRECMVQDLNDLGKIHGDKSTGTDSWIFHLAHPNMVRLEEVARNINRDRPLGFLKLDERVVVFVHGSLIRKSHLINIRCDMKVKGVHYLESLGVTYYDIRQKDIKVMIHWAKQVRSASWGDKANRVEAEVFIPKI